MTHRARSCSISLRVNPRSACWADRDSNSRSGTRRTSYHTDGTALIVLKKVAASMSRVGG